eukprot:scaffold1181_cov152-Amphora_coffeaeformis.AAC.10
MTWAKTWDNILQGGPTRWKVDNVDLKKRALARIHEYMNMESPSGVASKNNPPLKILCPLAGDDLFVSTAWREGHDVTAIDLVPAAVGVMRQQFGGSEQDWTTTSESSQGASFTSTVVWKHKSGRATLYAGDMMQKRPELNGKFDVIYDKDSFGALPLELRPTYCQRLAEYCKPNSMVYTEVKCNYSGKASGGPPFHVEKEDLMEPTSFGTHFHHVASLGEVYSLNIPDMKQTGHILRRK